MNSKPKLELNWIGKYEDIKLEPRILIEDTTNSYGDANTENMIIHGDNLLSLKALEQEYSGKIKCVYIDPPFNTGQAFENYDDNQEHSIWLNLMNERLKILYKLLSEDGVLWVHLDDTEVHYCKIILDEIFGRSNFVGQINYERSGSAGIGQGGVFVDTAEYILMYKKNEACLSEGYNYVPLEKKVMKRYNKILINEGDKELIDEFPSKSNGLPVKIFKHKNYTFETISLKSFKQREQEIREEYTKNFNKIFRTTNPQAENQFQNDLISRMDGGLYSVEYTPSRGKDKDKYITRYYNNNEIFAWLKDSAVLKDNRVVKVNKLTNIWTHGDIPKADLANEGGVKFKRGKKPEQLLKRILEISTNEGDMVLDSFLGSGTTAAVAHKMNRKYIGIELGGHAHTHCLERLKNIVDSNDVSGISKVVNWQGGGGFKFYELAPSLLKKDKFGNWIIDEKYNADMLAGAMAKHQGFHYQPDEECYWKQGYSYEKDYIYTTTNFITIEYLDSIYSEMGEEESLLICCKAFQTTCKNRYNNIDIKKIPQVLLGKCEFGKEDYKLNIIEIPEFEDINQEADENE